MRSPTWRWWMLGRLNWCAAPARRWSVRRTSCRNTKRAGARRSSNRIFGRSGHRPDRAGGFPACREERARKKDADGIRFEELDTEGVRWGGNLDRRRSRHCRKRSRQRSSLWADGGIRFPDSRGRLALVGRLGEEENAGKRLLRHHLDGLSRRESAGGICEGLWRGARCARRGDRPDSQTRGGGEATARMAGG